MNFASNVVTTEQNNHETIDELEAINIIKDVGYDAVFIYTNFDGKGIKKMAATKLVG